MPCTTKLKDIGFTPKGEIFKRFFLLERTDGLCLG